MVSENDSMHGLPGVSTPLPVAAVQDSMHRLMVDHCELDSMQVLSVGQRVTGVETDMCVLQERGARSGQDAT